MSLPDDFDCVIVGTGLVESMVAASLAVTGNAVLHIDGHDYYGGYMTSFRFDEFLKKIELWSSSGSTVSSQREAIDGLNLMELNHSLIQHCSSTFLVGDSEEPPVVPSETHSTPQNPGAENASTPNLAGQLPQPWTKSSLSDSLRRADFDILPRFIFAESPLVKALVRSDVTRYLEFQSVNRLLFYNPSATGAAHSSVKPNSPSNHPVLVKVPVSRGEVFQTRILSLAQKRMLVGFLEWCASVMPPDTDTDFVVGDLDESTLGPEVAVYLNRPLVEYLQEKRSLDAFVAHVVVNCFAFSNDDITLRCALPRFRRLISSMNRVGPFPLLWPTYGCGELPQSFCRMCAVFSGTYCLGRSLTGVRTASAEGSQRQRTYQLRLSTGEEVSTSCLLIGAEQAPTAWLRPKIQRWLARAILVTSASVFSAGHEPHDITLVPLPLSTGSQESSEPAFLLELPVNKRDHRPSIYMVHLTAVCDDCINAADVFAEAIDLLFHSDASTSSPKPQVLWKCFFTLPDLSSVRSEGFARGFELSGNAEGIFVAPGPGASMFLHQEVSEAAQIFGDIFALLRARHEALATTSSDETTAAEGGEALPLDQNWDGVFPPRPPRPEDLVFSDEAFADSAAPVSAAAALVTAGSSSSSTTEVPESARTEPILSGQGDWSLVAGPTENTPEESDFSTAVADP